MKQPGRVVALVPTLLPLAGCGSGRGNRDADGSAGPPPAGVSETFNELPVTVFEQGVIVGDRGWRT